MDGIRRKIAGWLGTNAAADEVLARAAADGVTDRAAAALVREEEWSAYGVPKIRARELVALLARGDAPPAPSAPSAFLAEVPDDRSLLALLLKGSTLRVEPTDLVASVRLHLAQRYGLDGVEERIAERIEARAVELEGPCPDIYWELTRALRRRQHAGVLAALDLPGTFVTERRQRELLARLPSLWRTVQRFDGELAAWDDAWRQRASHPQAMLASLAAVLADPSAGAPSGDEGAPDPSTVTASVGEVIQAVNRAHAGTGVVVARALAERVVSLMDLLADPRLVEATGAASRDDMLRLLRVDIPLDAARREKVAVQYLLTLVRVPELASAEQVQTLVALRELGRELPWELLSGAPPVASTRRAPTR